MNTRIKNGGEVTKKSLFASIFMVLPFVFVCFGLSPAVRAVVPAPDGGYPGFNTAEGTNALFSLTSGVGNNAIGFQALLHNTTGIHNTADGFAALSKNTTGQHNTATGDEALGSNTTGSFNTADGGHALENNTGTGNTALGFGAGANVTTATNVICLGAGVLGANDNNSCFIGNVFNRTSAVGAAVFVNLYSRPRAMTSSRGCFKKNIAPGPAPRTRLCARA